MSKIPISSWILSATTTYFLQQLLHKVRFLLQCEVHILHKEHFAVDSWQVQSFLSLANWNKNKSGGEQCKKLVHNHNYYYCLSTTYGSEQGEK